jgi:hypothetical protein
MPKHGEVTEQLRTLLVALLEKTVTHGGNLLQKYAILT